MSKRFVTYRTEDAKAGLVNVDENGVLKAGGSSPDGGNGGSGLNFDVTTEYIEVLAETELVSNIEGGDDEYVAYGVFIDGEEHNVSLRAGNKYRVIINGNEYVYHARIQNIAGSDETYNGVMVGNAYYDRDDKFTDTGEPFFIGHDNRMHSGLHINWSKDFGKTITIQIDEVKENFDQIDGKFVKSAPFVVNISRYWESRFEDYLYSPDQSFENICKAYESGRTVYAKIGDEEEGDNYFAVLIGVKYADYLDSRSIFIGSDAGSFVTVTVYDYGEVSFSRSDFA